MPLFLAGQNEYAATSFYTSLQNIVTDSKNGFQNYIGEKRTGQFDQLKKEYEIKQLLPLADSGKIIQPANGSSLAVFFFETEKKKTQIDKRAVNLKEAVLTAYNSKLYSRTFSTLKDGGIFSDTYFFLTSDEANVNSAIFRMNIYFENKRYHLLLEVRGK